jgi:hypothetical protein
MLEELTFLYTYILLNRPTMNILCKIRWISVCVVLCFSCGCGGHRNLGLILWLELQTQDKIRLIGLPLPAPTPKSVSFCEKSEIKMSLGPRYRRLRRTLRAPRGSIAFARRTLPPAHEDLAAPGIPVVDADDHHGSARAGWEYGALGAWRRGVVCVLGQAGGLRGCRHGGLGFGGRLGMGSLLVGSWRLGPKKQKRLGLLLTSLLEGPTRQQHMKVGKIFEVNEPLKNLEQLEAIWSMISTKDCLFKTLEINIIQRGCVGGC